MTWMLTMTGAVVDLRLVQPDQISLLDIAHGLSMLNRFSGQTCRPYSVAEHSLLVVEIMEREYAQHDPDALMAALLHDAHEAFVGDMVAPLKEAMRHMAAAQWRRDDDYARIERRIQADVLTRFDAFAAYSRHHAKIRRADLVALATERRDLLPPGGPTWPGLSTVKPVKWVQLGSRADLTWSDWRQAFLDKFDELRIDL